MKNLIRYRNFPYHIRFTQDYPTNLKDFRSLTHTTSCKTQNKTMKNFRPHNPMSAEDDKALTLGSLYDRFAITITAHLANSSIVWAIARYYLPYNICKKKSTNLKPQTPLFVTASPNYTTT